MLGEAAGLTLSGSPPASVRSSLRVLDELGILNDAAVWSMLSVAAVDPFYFIRTIRSRKAELGFHEAEHQVGDDIIFLAGDKNEVGYRVAYHVDVFTNDASVMVRGTDRYTHLKTISGMRLTEEVAALEDGREAAFLAKIKGAVDEALAYKPEPSVPVDVRR